MCPMLAKQPTVFAAEFEKKALKKDESKLPAGIIKPSLLPKNVIVALNEIAKREDWSPEETKLRRKMIEEALSEIKEYAGKEGSKLVLTALNNADMARVFAENPEAFSGFAKLNRLETGTLLQNRVKALAPIAENIKQQFDPSEYVAKTTPADVRNWTLQYIAQNGAIQPFFIHPEAFVELSAKFQAKTYVVLESLSDENFKGYDKNHASELLRDYPKEMTNVLLAKGTRSISRVAIVAARIPNEKRAEFLNNYATIAETMKGDTNAFDEMMINDFGLYGIFLGEKFEKFKKIVSEVLRLTSEDKSVIKTPGKPFEFLTDYPVIAQSMVIYTDMFLNYIEEKGTEAISLFSSQMMKPKEELKNDPAKFFFFHLNSTQQMMQADPKLMEKTLKDIDKREISYLDLSMESIQACYIESGNADPKKFARVVDILADSAKKLDASYAILTRFLGDEAFAKAFFANPGKYVNSLEPISKRGYTESSFVSGLLSIPEISDKFKANPEVAVKELLSMADALFKNEYEARDLKASSVMVFLGHKKEFDEFMKITGGFPLAFKIFENELVASECKKDLAAVMGKIRAIATGVEEKAAPSAIAALANEHLTPMFLNDFENLNKAFIGLAEVQKKYIKKEKKATEGRIFIVLVNNQDYERALDKVAEFLAKSPTDVVNLANAALEAGDSPAGELSGLGDRSKARKFLEDPKTYVENVRTGKGNN
ncbi:MAG: hypothetical protein V1909_02335 [Candidatus Micrarchaeota archaeon]